MTQRIQVRRGTAADATAANPVLAPGEIGFETDTGNAKIGDGVTAWNSLAYFGATPAAADVAFTPAGDLAATNVQAALTELDTEKAAVGHTHSTPTIDGCRIKTSADLTVNTLTDTYLPCGAEVFDTANYHDNVTNNSRITIPTGKAGTYLIVAAVRYSANSTGERHAGIHLNGTNTELGYTRLGVGGSSGVVVLTHSMVLPLVVGDYIQGLAWQNSGSTLTVPSGWGSVTALRLGS